MVIVKDLSKLEKYGFQKCAHAQTYEKILSQEEGTLSLLVNPVGSEENNELFVYCFDDGVHTYTDVMSNLDIIFEMLQDGVIEYKNGK